MATPRTKSLTVGLYPGVILFGFEIRDDVGKYKGMLFD